MLLIVMFGIVCAAFGCDSETTTIVSQNVTLVATVVSQNSTSNSTEVAVLDSESEPAPTSSSTQTHLRAKRQWGGCRYENCEYYGGCGGGRNCGYGGCQGNNCGYGRCCGNNNCCGCGNNCGGYGSNCANGNCNYNCGSGGCGNNCGSGGCGTGCNGNPSCGTNGCIISQCNNPICGRMRCTDSQPRPCVGCGMSRQCCPCCMPRCSRQCIRGGGCYCDYDYNSGWGRKRRHAIEFQRPTSEKEETTTAVVVL